MKRLPSIMRREKRGYSPAANMTAPGFTAAMTAPAIAGIMVTPQTALTFSAYFACQKVIAEDLASLPYCVWQRYRDGGSKIEMGHPVSVRFNRSPDGEVNDLNWREAWLAQCIGWGTAYSEIVWDSEGYPESLHMIHPSLIVPKRQPSNGRLYYEVQSAIGGNSNARKKILEPYRVLNLASLGFNGLVGYSTVALNREGIGAGKAMEQFGSAFFGNGAHPHGVLEVPGKLKDEARKNLRESWNLVHQGSASANKIALLEEGITWKLTQVSPENAQFLASRAFQVIEMCRIMRVPPHKVGDFSQAHLANIEAANDDYIISCLRPWAARWEKSVDWKLLTNDEWVAGFYTKHDFRPLLLKLSKDRADYYRKLWEIGIYTVNEIRELEGLNPITPEEGGNLRFRPQNEAGLTDPATRPTEQLTDGKLPRGLWELLGGRVNDAA